MPPRYSYWTIIIDDKPTAFRAAMLEDLLPTFNRLKQKHPTAVMMWFQRGRLWPSRQDAQAAFVAERRQKPRPARFGPSADRPTRDDRRRPPFRDDRRQPPPRDDRRQPPPRDARGQSKPRDDRGQPKPRDARGQSKPRDDRGHPPPRDARGQPKPRDDRGHPPFRDKRGRPAATKDHRPWKRGDQGGTGAGRPGSGGPPRDRKWRPGGEHRDPRQKYKDAKKAGWTRFKQRIRQRFDRRTERKKKDDDES